MMFAKGLIAASNRGLDGIKVAMYPQCGSLKEHQAVRSYLTPRRFLAAAISLTHPG
jgi:hypothetical protein